MALTHETVAFGGWKNNLAISNDVCELLITLDVGPRILSFAPVNGQNVFKVFDDQVGGTEEDMWQSRGGHRLWLAPEGFPFSYYPDNDPVDYTIYPNGAVTLIAPDEMPQGFSKQIDVALDPKKARVRLVHRLVNVVDETQEVAAWMLSVMAPGGFAIVPQPRLGAHPGLGPGDFTANRSLVLWPFTDLSDSRFHLGPQYWTLQQDESKGPTKIGFNGPISWAGYFNNGTLFVKRFQVRSGDVHPDRNSALELFTNEEILEVETLGPLTKLKPGGTLEVVEEWELYTGLPTFTPKNDEAIAAALSITGAL